MDFVSKYFLFFLIALNNFCSNSTRTNKFSLIFSFQPTTEEEPKTSPAILVIPHIGLKTFICVIKGTTPTNYF